MPTWSEAPAGTVRAEHLSKRYLIGPGGPVMYGNLRERIMGMGPAMLRRLRMLRRSTEGAAEDEVVWALRDITFSVQPGEVVGLIGRNGAGKSTLLKVLSRITAPSAGFVEFSGRVGSLLEVGTGFHGELSGRENIFLNGAILGMSRAEIVAKLDDIVAFAEIERFLDTPVKHYSSGMYVRLAFAVAAHMETEVLLVDEVLAVGDLAFQRKCLGKMGDVARTGRTVFFVSHNMGSIARLCDRGLVLEQGELVFDGHVEPAMAHYNALVAGDTSADGATRHVLFEERPREDQTFAVTRLEILGRDGAPLPDPRTWDDVVLRVHCRCLERVRGAVLLELRHASGPRVLYLATEPDRGQPMVLERGSWSVDCRIERLPLAAGEYYIGAGLALPEVEYLWHRAEIARLVVHPNDVFRSGTPPQADRGLVVPHYDWLPPAPTDGAA